MVKIYTNILFVPKWPANRTMQKLPHFIPCPPTTLQIPSPKESRFPRAQPCLTKATCWIGSRLLHTKCCRYCQTRLRLHSLLRYSHHMFSHRWVTLTRRVWHHLEQERHKREEERQDKIKIMIIDQIKNMCNVPLFSSIGAFPGVWFTVPLYRTTEFWCKSQSNLATGIIPDPQSLCK